MEKWDFAKYHSNGTWSLYKKSGVKQRSPLNQLIEEFGSHKLLQLIERSLKEGYINKKEYDSMCAELIATSLKKKGEP